MADLLSSVPSVSFWFCVLLLRLRSLCVFSSVRSLWVCVLCFRSSPPVSGFSFLFFSFCYLCFRPSPVPFLCSSCVSLPCVLVLSPENPLFSVCCFCLLLRFSPSRWDVIHYCRWHNHGAQRVRSDYFLNERVNY
jgi:hypothetical protein